MTAWIITTLLGVIVGAIVYAEVRCGRRTKNFMDNVMPEIEALNESVASKYRAKYGKDPTLQSFPIVNPDRK